MRPGSCPPSESSRARVPESPRRSAACTMPLAAGETNSSKSFAWTFTPQSRHAGFTTQGGASRSVLKPRLALTGSSSAEKRRVRPCCLRRFLPRRAPRAGSPVENSVTAQRRGRTARRHLQDPEQASSRGTARKPHQWLSKNRPACRRNRTCVGRRHLPRPRQWWLRPLLMRRRLVARRRYLARHSQRGEARSRVRVRRCLSNLGSPTLAVRSARNRHGHTRSLTRTRRLPVAD
jgi:hypothetical protein